MSVVLLAGHSDARTRKRVAERGVLRVIDGGGRARGSLFAEAGSLNEGEVVHAARLIAARHGGHARRLLGHHGEPDVRATHARHHLRTRSTPVRRTARIVRRAGGSAGGSAAGPAARPAGGATA